MSSASEGVGGLTGGIEFGGGFFILEKREDSFGFSALVVLRLRKLIRFCLLLLPSICCCFLALLLLLCIMDPKLSFFIMAGLWDAFFVYFIE